LAGSTASVDGDITGYKGGSYDYWVVKLKDFTTEVKEVKNEFSLFPNPATEKLFIELVGDSFNTRITLFDAFGQKIMSRFADQKLNTISLQNLPEGMYFVEVSTNNKISTTKIVKINP
jgi:Secretion system C-terminal sorting domain